MAIVKFHTGGMSGPWLRTTDANKIESRSGSKDTIKQLKNQGNLVVDLDGSNDYVSINGLITQCANYTVGTIAFWFKADAWSGQDTLFEFSRNASADDAIMTITHQSATGLDIGMLTSAGGWFWRWAGTSILSTAAWHHFAIVHDGTSPKIYLNGTDITTTGGSFTVTTDKTKWLKYIITDIVLKADVAQSGIRRLGGATLLPLDGRADKIQVYSTALSASDVLALYNETMMQGNDTPAGCVCNLKFDNNTANDYSTSGNNGTLVNGAAIVSDSGSFNYPSDSPVLYETTDSNKFGNIWAGETVKLKTNVAVTDTGIAKGRVAYSDILYVGDAGANMIDALAAALCPAWLLPDASDLITLPGGKGRYRYWLTAFQSNGTQQTSLTCYDSQHSCRIIELPHPTFSRYLLATQ